jgi:hypothetical protein
MKTLSEQIQEAIAKPIVKAEGRLYSRHWADEAYEGEPYCITLVLTGEEGQHLTLAVVSDPLIGWIRDYRFYFKAEVDGRCEDVGDKVKVTYKPTDEKDVQWEGYLDGIQPYKPLYSDE